MYDMSSQVAQVEVPPIESVQRRKDQRVRTVLRVGKMMTASDAGLCRLFNLSDGGAMVETGISLRAGDRVQLGLSDDVLVAGIVVWVTPGRAGLRFDRPIDSLGLLRRLSDDHWRGAARAPRVSARSAPIAVDGYEEPGELIDISQAGLKLRHSAYFLPGLQVKIRLGNGDKVKGTVRWSSDGVAGIQLCRTLSYDRLTRLSDL